MAELTKLQKQLFELQDLKYRDFHSKLMPETDKETVIGIRTPVLRKFAKEFAGTSEAEAFLRQLPHRYYEENNLHMMLITGIKDYEKCMEEIQRFLPCIDNWATCDYPAPKCFARHKDQVLEEAKRWISSGETYVIRYGIGMLMRLFLDEDFSSEYLEMAAAVQSQEYYVNMMIGILPPPLPSSGMPRFPILNSINYQTGYTERPFRRPWKATGSHRNRRNI